MYYWYIVLKLSCMQMCVNYISIALPPWSYSTNQPQVKCSNVYMQRPHVQPVTINESYMQSHMLVKDMQINN